MTTNQLTDWCRSETRTVRPFVATRDVANALDGCSLRLKSGEPFISSDSIKIAITEVGKLEPTLRLSVDPLAVSALASEDRRAMKCMVFVESSFAKYSELISEYDLDIEAPVDIEVPVDLSRRLRLGSSSSLSVVLCLVAERPKTPGKPFHKGHWLAKKTFELNVEKDAVAFSVEPLDEPARVRFGLPQGTLYYIQYLGGFNEPVVPDSPPARVYVAKEVIDRLSLATQQRNASIVEALLAAEITSAIVIRAFSDMGPDEETTPGSPLACLVKRLQDGFAVEAPTVRKWATDNNGLMLRAYLHADCQTVRNILSN